ncbi:hypothetical protein [Parachitinimonas caeni]|uniref:DUF3828 domain-containing protein n=1 Tax=Parachitinimonas caeni TaxID=3031301 RepID=A0ABT7E0Q3_9NEIS|nr:hypothetical protein [Parachitinimonas caeni]MDK2125895.1 hypothetical protein [Parachitinimonas caeni]
MPYRSSGMTLALALMSTAALAQPTCVPPDPRFHLFLQKFQDQPGFQRNRVQDPLLVEEWDSEASRRSALSKTALHAQTQPLILPRAQINPNHPDPEMRSQQTIEKQNAQRYRVIQSSVDNDIWQKEYRFERIKGCWMLVSIRQGGM